MNVWCVLVAAGSGSRAGQGGNKAFAKVRGLPVLHRTLVALRDSLCFDGIILVLKSGEQPLYARMCEQYGAHLLVKGIATGGDTRQESVKNGLSLVPDSAKIIAIHDAARPFVTKMIIDATIDSAIACGSGVAATKVTDTIKRASDDWALNTLDRTELRAVQTPQVFRADIIRGAYAEAEKRGITATDDAALCEALGILVKLVVVDGGEANIKLTFARDFVSEIYSAIGQGFDAHRLVEGRKLILCGVNVPFEKGLLGHSDADVAIHALIDALFGACDMGDIGKHFPDNDAKYKDISSIFMLEKVREMIDCEINNVDITIVAQRPKLAPYVDEMRKNMARALQIALERVSVKATTTEGMGFTGGGEGIAATAVCSVVRSE